MNKYGTILLFTILINAFTSYSQSDWRLYENQDYNFEIKICANVKHTSISTIENNKKVNRHIWDMLVSDKSSPNYKYCISIDIYPEELLEEQSSIGPIDRIINTTQKEFIKSNKYKLLSSSYCHQQLYPGKAFKWENKISGNIIESRIYIVKNRIYYLSVYSLNDKDINTLTDTFFNSLNLKSVERGSYSTTLSLNNKTFSVEFPESPKNTSKTVNSEYGKLHLLIQSLESTNTQDNLAYMAMETKYPNGTIDYSNTYDLNKFYKNTIEGSVDAVHGNIVSINDIYYKKQLGKEYKYYIADGKAIMVNRIFYINDYLYSQAVITHPNNHENKYLKKFMKSFKVM